MREAFTEQLKRAIRDCGETRYSLAKRTGTDQSTLTRFMNGTRGLSMEALDRLFDALDLEITVSSRRWPRATRRSRSSNPWPGFQPRS
jgi:transcriptional regulator with XRE-family HTH domain